MLLPLSLCHTQEQSLLPTPPGLARPPAVVTLAQLPDKTLSLPLGAALPPTPAVLLSLEPSSPHPSLYLIIPAFLLLPAYLSFLR